MPSILKRIRRVFRKDPTLTSAPHQPPPPPYEVCTEGDLRFFAGRASFTAALKLFRVEGAQHAIMSGTLDAFEITIEEASRNLSNDAPDAYEDVAPSQTIIRIVDALHIGLRTGLDSGDPFNHSMAALRAALTAVLIASRSAIRLQFQPPGDSQSQSRQCIAEAESEATEAGVRAGKSALPPEFSILPPDCFNTARNLF
ncbi:hypothetical protein ANO14919_056470 [Xylariales sp. No.14919]|nr:hypothetical protein ANO14919_056470 [Xylariales sp. No.14919]